jgi:hypothetical protein
MFAEMNDPLTLILAICTFVAGIAALIRPGWFHDPAKPEKRNKTRLLGLALIATGAALLYCVLFLNK